MQFDPYVITELTEIVPQVFRLKVERQDKTPIFQFSPGQFAQIKNPDCDRPDQPHSFSIASTPDQPYLEFCFKVYGPWTQAFAKKPVGEVLMIAGPFGRFVAEPQDTPIVFLAGGIGVVPMLSILRSFDQKRQQTPVTLIYGNRTEADIAYRGELEHIIDQLPQSKVVHILSDVQPGGTWQGHTGFVTKELVESEAMLDRRPTFFLCGPPIFVQKMKDVLRELAVDQAKIKQELYSSPPPPKASTS